MNAELGKALFAVTVYYREPTYELVAGCKAEPYRWTYRVFAPDEANARELALREFEEMARLSSVAWVRRVVRIDTARVGAAA